jgi:carboxyl-terminal processing protease
MNTHEEMGRQLEALEAEAAPLKGLVIDLRDNPGGLLDQAIKMADFFLNAGTIVSIKGRDQKDNQDYQAHPDRFDKDYPIVVLINGGSASASEIVAGALQDHARALILGTPSFGKGSVQTVRPLKDGYGLKYTIARYYTPNGRSIQAKGIQPDIEVDSGILEQTRKKASVFDRMIKEKDLPHSLMPEEDAKETSSEETSSEETVPDVSEQQRQIKESAELLQDVQVKRALDILISYGVFSNLNDK